MKRLVFALLLLLPACGNDGEPSAAPPSASIQVTETATSVTIASDRARLEIDKRGLDWRLHAIGGGLLTRSHSAPLLTTADGAYQLTNVNAVAPLYRDGARRGVVLTCDSGAGGALLSIEFLRSRSLALRIRPLDTAPVLRVAHVLQAADGERYYGLMQRIVDAPSATIRDRQSSEVSPEEVGSLDRRGTTVTMIVNPTIGLYTPFFHSSRGYGAYVEGTMPGKFDLAKGTSDAVVIDFELNPRLGEHGLVLFAGDHEQILDEYTALTGRPFVPPRWGFKHWRWRGEHEVGTPVALDGVPMNAQLVEDITMYEQLNIPAGNYEIDRPWTTGETDRGEPGFASFTINPQRFPNPPAMLAALERRGYRVFIWGGPWALGDNAVDAQRFGYYAPRNNILIDFTNPDAIAWWQGRVATLIDQGIRGMKLDRGELQPTVTELPNVPDRLTDIWSDGRNGREMKNAYITAFAKTHFDVFQSRLGDDFLHYYRAGYAGTQQYGVFWGGDITAKTLYGLGVSTDLGLRSSLLGLMHVAFMGFPIWGTDTGGYYEFADREVFARWLLFSAVNPIMEIGGVGAHTPWNMPTEPAYDTEMIDIYRQSVRLHHSLIPFLYNLAIESGRSGRPIARPLLFEFPDDPEVADLWDQFLLGRELLVAPVWRSGARSREIYFPQGTWIDVNTGQKHAGPARRTFDVPINHLPMFARAGALLPVDLSPYDENGLITPAGQLTLDAFPEGSSSFTLREESGTITFTLSDTNCGRAPCARLTSSAGEPRPYQVRLLMPEPERVGVGGTPLPRIESYSEWLTVERGWHYDVQGRVLAKFAATGPIELVAGEAAPGS